MAPAIATIIAISAVIGDVEGDTVKLSVNADAFRNRSNQNLTVLDRRVGLGEELPFMPNGCGQSAWEREVLLANGRDPGRPLMAPTRIRVSTHGVGFVPPKI